MALTAFYAIYERRSDYLMGKTPDIVTSVDTQEKTVSVGSVNEPDEQLGQIAGGPEQPPETMWSSPLSANSMTAAINLFAKVLAKNGVDQSVIDKSLGDVANELNVLTSKISKPAKKNFPFSKVDDPMSRRNDYLGRALMSHIEKYFPKDENDRGRIVNESIQGFLPNTIAEGLINAIKSSNRVGEVHEREKRFLNKAAMYRRKSDMLIDVARLMNDKEIRAVVKNMMRVFENFFKHMGEKKGEEWIMQNISQSQAFVRMNRNLTEDEYSLIRDHIFEIGSE